MSTAHTAGAGAAIWIEAEMGRITSWRGTILVVRPDEGGHEDMLLS